MQEESKQGQSQRIALEKLLNTRDLGGLRTKDGACIRHKALIRSEALSKASDSDIAKLKNEYRVTTIIDLRSDAERQHHPDPLEKFSDVRYRSIPLLNGQAIGIARGSREQYFAEIETISHDPIGAMTDIYPKIVLDETSERGIRDFFNELLNESEGSVLWHCSMGKDRVGISTALLLTVLGVSEGAIIDDYLATNGYLHVYTQDMLKAIESLDISLGVKDSIRVLNSVDMRFFKAAFDAINVEYGDLDTYMIEALDVTHEKTCELRKKYLIEGSR